MVEPWMFVDVWVFIFYFIIIIIFFYKFIIIIIFFILVKWMVLFPRTSKLNSLMPAYFFIDTICY